MNTAERPAPRADQGVTSGAHECFCDRQYKDANKLESCGDCPRDYIAGAWDARRKHIEEYSKMTDRQITHGGIMNWIRMTDRKPTADDADESGTVWVYDKAFTDVSSVHFYRADSPYYTHWMPKEKRPAPPAPSRRMTVDELIERLNEAWRKLYGDGDEHGVCDTLAEAAAALEAAHADRDVIREALRAEVERVTCELMDAITRAEKLAEASRQLVSMYERATGLPCPPQLRRAITAWDIHTT